MSIQEKIDEVLKKESERERKPSGKFSPSRFGRCYRFQYWKRKGEKESNLPDDRALRVFKVGNIFHDFVEGFMDGDYEKEVRIETEDILGYADLIGKDEAVDIKSQHSKAFWYMEKEGNDIAKEKYTNWLQVAWYAWTKAKEWCRLVFVSKDDLCIKEYTMPTAKWISELEKELATLRKHWVKQELPPALPRAYGGKECEYCSYRDRCSDKPPPSEPKKKKGLINTLYPKGKEKKENVST